LAKYGKIKYLGVDQNRTVSIDSFKSSLAMRRSTQDSSSRNSLVAHVSGVEKIETKPQESN